MRKHFSQPQIEEIKAKAEEMLVRSIVQWYIPIGSHDVCLKRECAASKEISIFRMGNTLSRNDANCRAIKARNRKGQH